MVISLPRMNFAVTSVYKWSMSFSLTPLGGLFIFSARFRLSLRKSVNISIKMRWTPKFGQVAKRESRF